LAGIRTYVLRTSRWIGGGLGLRRAHNSTQAKQQRQSDDNAAPWLRIPRTAGLCGKIGFRVDYG